MFDEVLPNHCYHLITLCIIHVVYQGSIFIVKYCCVLTASKVIHKHTSGAEIIIIMTMIMVMMIMITASLR